ncbi:MAG: phasin family protein [Pseudomonadota bacterium]
MAEATTQAPAAANGAARPETVDTKPAASTDAKTGSVRRTVRKSAPAAKSAAATKEPARTAPRASSGQDASPTAASGAFVVGNMTEMLGQARDRYEQLAGELNANAEVLREGADEASEAIRSATEAARDGARELSNQLAEFTQEEISRVLDYTNAVMKCKSVSEYMEAHSDFVSRLLETRADRIRDLNARSMDMAMQTLTPWSESVSSMLARAGELTVSKKA